MPPRYFIIAVDGVCTDEIAFYLQLTADALAEDIQFEADERWLLTLPALTSSHRERVCDRHARHLFNTFIRDRAIERQERHRRRGRRLLKREDHKRSAQNRCHSERLAVRSSCRATDSLTDDTDSSDDNAPLLPPPDHDFPTVCKLADEICWEFRLPITTPQQEILCSVVRALASNPALDAHEDLHLRPVLIAARGAILSHELGRTETDASGTMRKGVLRDLCDALARQANTAVRREQNLYDADLLLREALRRRCGLGRRDASNWLIATRHQISNGWTIEIESLIDP